jgi:hypothetical protein
MKTIVLNTTRFFCTSQICAASDCRCPKVERVPYPTIKEWLSDASHVRQTAYMVLIAAISIAVYVFGVWNR